MFLCVSLSSLPHLPSLSFSHWPYVPGLFVLPVFFMCVIALSCISQLFLVLLVYLLFVLPPFLVASTPHSVCFLPPPSSLCSQCSSLVSLVFDLSFLFMAPCFSSVRVFFQAIKLSSSLLVYESCVWVLFPVSHTVKHYKFGAVSTVVIFKHYVMERIAPKWVKMWWAKIIMYSHVYIV